MERVLRQTIDLDVFLLCTDQHQANTAQVLLLKEVKRQHVPREGDHLLKEVYHYAVVLLGVVRSRAAEDCFGGLEDTDDDVTVLGDEFWQRRDESLYMEGAQMAKPVADHDQTWQVLLCVRIQGRDQLGEVPGVGQVLLVELEASHRKVCVDSLLGKLSEEVHLVDHGALVNIDATGRNPLE